MRMRRITCHGPPGSCHPRVGMASSRPAMPAGLAIAHIDAETGFSGGEVQVFLLMEGLRARGHRNVLVAPPGSRAEAEAIARGFESRGVPMRGDLDAAAVLRLRHALEGAR